jgi:hypothetical protein
MTDRQNDELDSILDAALSEYSNRAPRPGFEYRILQGVQAAPSASRLYRRLGWALAAVSMAAIALAGILRFQEPPRPRPLPQIASAVRSPLPPLPETHTQAIAQVVSRRTKSRKREKYPEPELLTDGERALLRFARSEPEQARQLVADSAQMKELKIDPLKIDALP